MSGAKQSSTAEFSTPNVSVPFEATVHDVLGARGVRVERDRGEVFEATVAVAGGYEPAVDDRVLVLRGEDRAWVVGIIRALREVQAGELRARDGVAAELGAEGRTLTVRDAAGGLLFEHDATTGMSLVRAPAGLRVEAAGGDLDLSAQESVHIRAGRRVVLEAGEEAAVTARDGESRFALGLGGAKLTTTALNVVSGVGKLALSEGVFAVDRLETAVRKGRHYVGVAETRAGRLVERVKEAYREVEGLQQTRAQRIRTVARGAYSVLSQRATIKSEDDLTLLGERIHLA